MGLSWRWPVRARESGANDAGPESSARRDALPQPSSRRGAPWAARAAGDVIAGKYALRGLLGKGGMGSVWQAKHLTLGVDVAIKLILPSLATTEAGDRLFREARSAALLDHPNIVRVFDFGWSEHQEPFIVMELLRGATLAQLLSARLRLPADLAVQLVLPVASALEAAHAHGIVHRDIKPDNIVLVGTPQGTIVPKVVDFGIAKLLHEDASLTRAGAVVGSPSYMAPEQASGGFGVDERADVWALCVVLYESLAGFRPYERDGRRLLLTNSTEEPTPTSALGAGDEDLWQIVRRGLSIDPKERWPSMQELGVALAEWALGRGIEVDVTGSGLWHHWRGRASWPAVLDLPMATDHTETSETTEWAFSPPLPLPPPPPSRPELAEAPPPLPSSSRLRGARLSLTVLVAATVAIALAWSLRGAGRTAADALAAKPGATAPSGIPSVNPSSAGPGEDVSPPVPTAEPKVQPRGEAPPLPPSASPSSVPPADSPPQTGPVHRSSGMPLPSRPNF